MSKKYKTVKKFDYENLFDQLESERQVIGGEIDEARVNCQIWKQQNEELLRINSEHQQDIDILIEEKKALRKRLESQSFTLSDELVKRRLAYSSHHGKTILKDTHRQLVRKIIQRVGAHIQSVLQVPKESVVSIENHKEQYKIYGILLSACVLKQHRLKERSSSIIDKVLETVSISHKEIIRPHVIKAVEMTQKMLLILPPLIIWKPPEYNEHLVDTNRLTWDETTRDGVCLKYYRPVLLYGNNLHVAVKGLVGNKEYKALDGESVDELTHSTNVTSQEMVIHSQEQRHDNSSSSLDKNATGMHRNSGHLTRSFSSGYGQHSNSPCANNCYKDQHKPDVEKVTNPGYQ